MTSIKARELLKAIESCTDLSGPRSNLDNLHKCIEKCIKEGWDKNTDVPWTGKNGRKHLYPLIHWAAVLGKCNALEWLLKRGFSPLAKSSGTGETALHRAVHMPLIERKPRQNVNRLIEKFPRTVKLLNEALPIKNKKDGGTPLHRAAYLLVNEDCKANLKFFVTCCKEIANEGKKMGYDSDAILNSVNDSGETALHILARCEKDKVVYCTQAIKALSAAGAKGNIYNEKGYTALDIAVDLGTDPIIKELRKTIPVVKVDDPAVGNSPVSESLCEPGCSDLLSHPPSILDKLFDADVAASAETSYYEDKDNEEEDTYCPRDAHAQPSKETLEDRGDPCQLHLSPQRHEEQASSSTSTSPNLNIEVVVKLIGETGVTLEELVAKTRQNVEEFDAQISNKEEKIKRKKAEISIEEEKIERKKAKINSEEQKIERQKAEIRREEEKIERKKTEIRTEEGKIERMKAEISSEEEIIERKKIETSAWESKVGSLKRKREERYGDFVEYEKIQKACNCPQRNITSSHGYI